MLKHMMLFRSAMTDMPHGGHEGWHPYHTDATDDEMAAFTRALLRNRKGPVQLRIVSE